MFEYLMPMLVMPTYENTLLDQTCRSAVERQIEYGRQRAVPWGMSESGYNVTDAHLNYQYRAFGVPGLGFKRGLAEDLVVAPYASLLALMVAPHEACANLRQMADEGFLGPYGFFEAIDYTPSRVPVGQSYAIVRSFMAHHQGMSLLGLAYRLLDRPMQRRFEASAMIRASELLLQERIPKVAPFYPHSAEVLSSGQIAAGHESMMRVFNSPQTAAPEVHLLSNGRYHVMVTNAGGGYSRWKDTAVTRWDEDATRDNRGHVLLFARHDQRRRLVASLSTDAAQSRRLRSDFHPGPGRIPSPRFRHRRSHRHRRFAGRRHRSAAADDHQPLARGADAGTDQLCRGRADASGGRYLASGVQQSVRSDRDHLCPAVDPGHAPAAVVAAIKCLG